MLSIQQIILRLVVASLLGSIVGLERERKDWAAGLRTHMLVCVGSALAMIVSTFGFSDILGTPNVVLDPSRIAAQVISGIGFLGAGTILFLRNQVIRGLTTAAGLWTVAAIGLAAGSGMYAAAGITTALAIIILAGIKPIERKFFDNQRHRTIKIIFHRNGILLKDIEAAIDALNLQLMEVNIQRGDLQKQEDYMQLILARNSSSKAIMKLVDNLRNIEGIKEVNFMLIDKE